MSPKIVLFKFFKKTTYIYHRLELRTKSISTDTYHLLISPNHKVSH